VAVPAVPPVPPVIFTVRPLYSYYSLAGAMSFQIYSGERFIGSSALGNLDPPMGIATGDFLPSKDYHTVQPLFRLYAEATVSEGSQDWAMGSGLQLVAAPSVNAAFLVAAKSRRRRNQAVCQQVGN